MKVIINTIKSMMLRILCFKITKNHLVDLTCMYNFVVKIIYSKDSTNLLFCLTKNTK